MMGHLASRTRCLCSMSSHWRSILHLIICSARQAGSSNWMRSGARLAGLYGDLGRPSIDPELMIRMLIVGYCFGIRSERRLCEEVHLTSCTAGSAGSASTARFRTLPRSPRAGTGASGRATSCAACSNSLETLYPWRASSAAKAFSIDASLIKADANRQKDGTFSRDDFTYDHERDVYRCPGGTALPTTGTLVNDGTTMLYRSLQHECAECALKPRCCPNTPARKVPRSIHEGARDMARQIAKSWEGATSRRLRKKVEMLFAHLKRILKLDRLRLRGPTGAHDEFLLAATAQNLRKLAKLVPTPKLKAA